MSASTANRTDTTIDMVQYLEYDAGAVHLYQFTHAMVIIGTGNAIPAADTANGAYIGMVLNECDNSAGSAGDLKVQIVPPNEVGYVEVDASTAAKSWLEKVACWSDDHTVALAGTTTNDVRAGTVKAIISASKVVIDVRDRFAYPAADANR